MAWNFVIMQHSFVLNNLQLSKKFLAFISFPRIRIPFNLSLKNQLFVCCRNVMTTRWLKLCEFYFRNVSLNVFIDMLMGLHSTHWHLNFPFNSFSSLSKTLNLKKNFIKNLEKQSSFLVCINFLCTKIYVEIENIEIK